MNKTDSHGHIVELQSLRGFAAVAVMIGHALSFYTQPAWFAHTGELFASG